MVSQKKPRNRKSKAVINLSESVEVSEKFEVKNYDYKDLQQPLDPFEKDLDYLLGGKEDAVFRETGVTEELIIHELVLPVEDVASRAKKRFSRNGKKLAVLANDIASDIQDLNFSSSDEENVSPKKENQPKKKTGKKKKKQQQSEVAVADGVGAEDEADELDVKSALKFVQGILVEEKGENAKKKRIRKRKNKQPLNDSANDIPPQQSQSQSESQSPSQSPSPAPAPAPTSSSSPSVSQSEKKVGERKSKKLLNSKLAESVQAQENEKYAGSEKNNNSPALAQPESVSSKESEIQTPTRSRKRKPKKKVTESELTELTELTELLTESDNTILVGENNELATVEELKKKKVIDQDFSIYDSEVNLSRNQRQRLKQTSPTGAEHITPTPGIINDSVDSITETPISSCSTIAAKTPISFTTPVKRPETTPIKNHSVVGTATPENPFAINLRSTKTTISNGKFAENLPEIHPIKTIIGLNHKQVLNLSLSDVKIKAIISSSLTAKFVANILKFALKHSHSIFSDVEVRAKFIKLCINVALYESVGFKKTSKEFDVEELFGCYPEITLETTGTKLTPPTEKFHQNQFDYSVLSFIGHVLIWAYSLQLQAGLPTFFEKYDLDIDQKEIRKNIGGDHLWDRLNRSLGSLNTKRWKHISKFRDSFGFYEDQFMLILRFLNVDDTIP